MKYDEHSLGALILHRTEGLGGKNDYGSVSEAAHKVSVVTMATQCTLKLQRQ